MNYLVCRASAAADAEQFPSASHRDALQVIGTALLGIWRTFAVVFFSLFALVQNAIILSFTRRARHLHTRAAWLHHCSRFACRGLGTGISARSSMPSAVIFVVHHLTSL